MAEPAAHGGHAATAAPRFAVHGAAPGTVLTPASPQEAAAMLRDAAASGTAVECAGAGSWLSWGLPPERLECVMSTVRLSGITEYTPADLVLSAGAGTPLSELRDAVAAENQALPFDPPAAAGATIGATVALADAGPLRTAWGTPRDQVLGLEIVTGDGRLLRLGGKVVKNVAGYDLVRLIVGSRGTLGLIIGVHVRLRPAPARDATFAAFAARPDALLDFARDVVRPLLPVALELVAPATSRRIGLAEPSWALLGRFRGNDSAVVAATTRIGRAGVTHRAAILEAEHAQKLWAELAAHEASAHVGIRLSAPPASILEAVASALSIAGKVPERKSDKYLAPDPSSGWQLAAHLDHGIVRLWSDRLGDTVVAADRVRAARQQIERIGGGLQLVVAPAALASTVDPYGHVGPAARLMRELKRSFDPATILSAGRYVA